jgi:hypothetical protein
MLAASPREVGMPAKPAFLASSIGGIAANFRQGTVRGRNISE